MADGLDQWGDPIDPESAPQTYSDPVTSPTLDASTGKNDSSSIWGSLGSQLPSWAQTGANVYKTVTGSPTNSAARPSVTGSSSGLSQYLPFILGGVALLVVLPLILKRR